MLGIYLEKPGADKTEQESDEKPVAELGLGDNAGSLPRQRLAPASREQPFRRRLMCGRFSPMPDVAADRFPKILQEC